MKTITVKSYALIAALLAGDADQIELESYEVNTEKGGGLFARVDASLPEVEGFRVKTADGVVFERRFPEDVRPSLHAEHIGWTPAFSDDAANFLEKLWRLATAANLPAEYPKSYIFRANRMIKLPRNLPGIIGNNSFVYFVFYKADFLGVLSDKGINHCKIENMHIDYDRADARIKQVIGLWLQDQQFCEVHNCNISSKENHSLLLRATPNLSSPLEGFVAEGVVTYVSRVNENDPRQNFLADVEEPGKADETWKETQTVPRRVGHINYRFTRCEAWCGRYGFAGNWATGFIIKDCLGYKNIRTLSFQNGCDGNEVDGLVSLEVQSAALHWNYAPTNNHVHDCVIKSSRANNQGAIHVSLGAHGNTFERINIECTSDTGMRWAVYGGADYCNNIMRDIVVNGRAFQGLAVFESGWVAGDKHGGYGGVINRAEGADIGKWQSGASVNNVFENVEINSDSVAAAVVIAAVEQNIDGFRLRNVRVNGERHVKDLRLIEVGGRIKNLTVDGVKIRPEKCDLGDMAMYQLYRPVIA